jgi:hypothetical protein
MNKNYKYVAKSARFYTQKLKAEPDDKTNIPDWFDLKQLKKYTDKTFSISVVMSLEII